MKTWLQLAQQQSKIFELAAPLIIGQTYTISMNSNEPFMIFIGDVFIGESVDGSLEFIATNSGDVMITSYSDISMELEIKLEKGNMATDWTPAPEDIEQELTQIKNVQVTHATNISSNRTDIDLKASIEEVGTLETRLDGDIVNVQNIASENASKINVNADSITNEVLARETLDGELRDEISSQVQQTVESFDVIFNKIESDQDLTNDEVALIQSYFRINENGVIIGKSDSAIEFFAENNRVGFRENGQDIAYWEEGTMHVDRLIAVMTIMVGYHLIEKYDSLVAGNTTIVRLSD